MTALRSAVRAALRPALHNPTANPFGFNPNDLGPSFFGDVATLAGTYSDGDPVDSFAGFTASGAARPTYKTDGTYHWLEFAGAQIMSRTIGLTQGFTLFAASRLTLNLTGTVVLLGDNSPLADIRMNSSEVYQINAGSVLSGSLARLDADCSVIGTYDNTSSELDVNGTVASGAAGTNNPSDFGLGGRFGGTLYFTGRIYAFGAVDNTLSAANKSQLRTWLASKSGATLD